MTTSATPAGRTSFTLLETVLVLALLGLVATILYPALAGGGRRIALGSADYELLWLLRQARWWSVSSGQVCEVRLKPLPDGYAAEVSYLPPGADRLWPLREEWARLDELPAIRRMVRIPPDRERMLRGELAVRFRPWGVNEDYVIDLAAAEGRGPARIEVRRPNGLVWLLPADEPGPFDPDSLRDMEAYWRSHCQESPRTP